MIGYNIRSDGSAGNSGKVGPKSGNRVGPKREIAHLKFAHEKRGLEAMTAGYRNLVAL